MELLRFASEKPTDSRGILARQIDGPQIRFKGWCVYVTYGVPAMAPFIFGILFL